MHTEDAIKGANLFPIPLAVMQPGTLAPVDLYIRLKAPERYLLYKRAHAPFHEAARQRLLERGVGALYLPKADERMYQDYVEENIAVIIRDDLVPVEESCKLVYETSSRVMTEVFDDPRSGRNMARARRVVEATVLSVLKRPDSLWHMRTLASHHYHTYTHCVHACMFLVASGQRLLRIRDRATLNRIGLGGILHDVGKSQIPDEILSKPHKLTADEFQQVKLHPLIGLDIARGVKRLPSVAGHIIRSHHEHLDGSGYPDRLAGEEISAIVRLSSIIDVYDALTTERAYSHARTPYLALELMLNETRGQFDERLLRSFVKFLGPEEG
jgi:HD-GYP domain-containing protein (c-di-GMP phosphodiesterase class II)